MISISLFVVLLATYCYSVPITKPVDITTPKYEFTTGKTMVDHENKINMHLVTDEESTGLPDIHKERSLIMNDKDRMEHDKHHDEHHGEHYDHDKHRENYDHKTRATEDSNEADVELEERSDSMEKRYRSGEIYRGDRFDNRHGDRDRYRHHVREFDETKESTTKVPLYGQPEINRIVSLTMDNLSKFLSTTMETKTQFEKKAIPSHESEEETPELSERGFHGKEMERTSTDINSFVSTSTIDKNVRTEPMAHTSGDSFGHMTGLLKTKREEKEETPESKREETEESKREETEESKREETEESKREEKDESESKREEKEESKREEKDESESKREEKEETPESKREEKEESKREETEESKREETEESKREEKDESESKREEKEETPESKREEKEESKREETEESKREETEESKREEKEESESKREEKDETPESKREESEKSEAKREEKDRSVEEPTTPVMEDTTRIVKIKVTETRIIGQKQPMDEKKKSNM